LCLTAMLVNQLLYTSEPARLKTKPLIDLISGSLINPFFRFYAGWILFIPFFNAPIELLIFVLGIQFGGYTLYRLESKEHETKLKYNSSIVLLPKKTIRLMAYSGMSLGAMAFLFSCFSGALKFEFIYLGLGSVLLSPWYFNAIKNPEKMNMKKMYRLLFIHYFLFILGVIFLSLI
jgi:4-hydroxybenzoate polyprenyltransferase